MAKHNIQFTSKFVISKLGHQKIQFNSMNSNSTKICLKENLFRQYSKVQVLSAAPIQLEIYAEQLILVQMILHLDVNSEYKVKV